jgi:glycosyltransferase involved in cell wall biosynthesis
MLVWEGKWFTGIPRADQFRFSGLKDLLLMRGTYNDYFAFRKRGKTEENILRRCRYYMGRTNFDRRIAKLIAPDARYFHCEEFIRKDFFEKEWKSEAGSEVVCISTIKATSYKGIDLIYKVAIILKRFTSLNVRFRICGVSENEEFVKIVRKKYRNDLEGLKIEFLGKLSANDLIENLCSSTFYIHPSYIENSPNSVCEAMATGIPVIATNVGGVSTLIEDQKEGILVQEGEPYSMAGAIVELTRNFEKAREMGRNARQRAIIRHDPKEILSTLLNTYTEIIKHNGEKNLS